MSVEKDYEEIERRVFDTPPKTVRHDRDDRYYLLSDLDIDKLYVYVTHLANKNAELVHTFLELQEGLQRCGINIPLKVIDGYPSENRVREMHDLMTQISKDRKSMRDQRRTPKWEHEKD